MSNPLFAPDPAFPDRPDHPDFWTMVEAVGEMDGIADNMDPELEGLGPLEVVTRKIGLDIDSMYYMAQQRALRAANLFGMPEDKDELQRFMTASWVDGFVMGMLSEQKRNINGVSVDGQHRGK